MFFGVSAGIMFGFPAPVEAAASLIPSISVGGGLIGACIGSFVS